VKNVTVSIPDDVYRAARVRAAEEGSSLSSLVAGYLRSATRQRFQISYWDAAILEAARSLGCETVLSEDLGDGQDYAGVTVENPFSAQGEA
jgi:predicted nucleic acid-binding protein